MKKQDDINMTIAREAKVYTVEQVAEMLNVQERTVRNYIATKKIEAFKVGQEWRIRHIDYVSFLNNSKKNTQKKQ